MFTPVKVTILTSDVSSYVQRRFYSTQPRLLLQNQKSSFAICKFKSFFNNLYSESLMNSSFLMKKKCYMVFLIFNNELIKCTNNTLVLY